MYTKDPRQVISIPIVKTLALAILLAPIAFSRAIQAAESAQVAQLLRYRDCQFCDLSNANLSGKFLKRAALQGANLSGANLGNAYLPKAILAEANLQTAYLVKANLRDVDLRSANLQGARLAQADLRNAYLRSANLENADLTGANLGGVALDGAILCNTRMPNETISYRDCPIMPFISISDSLVPTGETGSGKN